MFALKNKRNNIVEYFSDDIAKQMADPTNNIHHHQDNIVYVGIDPNKLESFQGGSLKESLQNLINKFCKVEEENVDVKLFANDNI